MKAVLLVGVGGFVGAVLRYGASRGLRAWLGEALPWGTLAVNVLGSLAIGALLGETARSTELSETWRLAIVVGLLGSFTTFSTMSYETVALFTGGQPGRAGIMLVANLVLGLAAVWLGSRLVG
jgi:fluoride exporter